MHNFVFKALIGGIILLIVPTIFIFLPPWSPTDLTPIAYPLYLLTETGTVPIALITCIALWGCFAYLLKIKSTKKLIQLTILLAMSTIVSQGVKSVIKYTTSEPRPYVIWMSENDPQAIDHFYSISRAERDNLIETKLATNTIVPNWLQSHWEKETGYSFPSGHTMFAALWAFLVLFFFRFKQHPIFVSAILVWAVLMELSRLELGMHFYIDVILSVLISLVLGILFYYFGRKWQLTE